MIRKFVENPVDFKEIENSNENLLYKKLKEKDFDYVYKYNKKLLTIFDYRTGIKKLRGWLFDYSEFMNTYWVKSENGIEEIKSFNSDFLIEMTLHPHEILKIVRVDGIGLTYEEYKK